MALVPGLKQGSRLQMEIKDVFAAEWEHKIWQRDCNR
jgi:hypothetical protein